MNWEFEQLYDFIRLINNKQCVQVALGLKISLYGKGILSILMNLIIKECKCIKIKRYCYMLESLIKI